MRRILLYIFMAVFCAVAAVARVEGAIAKAEGAESGTVGKDGSRCAGAGVAAFHYTIALRTVLSEDEKGKISRLKEALKKDGFERKTIDSIFNNDEFGIYDIGVTLFGGNPEKEADSGKKTYEWYRECLGLEERIGRAEEFIKNHADVLVDAEKKYGVDGRYIVSILGVESDFSKDPGRFKAINSLVTQYVLIEERKGYAYSQLKELVRYSKRTGMPLFYFSSSYAGAIGCAQFIPSSLNSYFVGTDGKIEKADPFDIIDCIYSVAYYLKVAGWDRSRNGKTPVEGSRNWKAIRAYNHSDAYTRFVIEMAGRLNFPGQPNTGR